MIRPELADGTPGVDGGGPLLVPIGFERPSRVSPARSGIIGSIAVGFLVRCSEIRADKTHRVLQQVCHIVHDQELLKVLVSRQSSEVNKI